MVTANKELSRKVISALIDNPLPVVGLVDAASCRELGKDGKIIQFPKPLAIMRITDSVWLVCDLTK